MDEHTFLFNDRQYEEQASYLAETTPLTEKQAEAYLRYMHAPDSATQRELANRMRVEETTFSNHLADAKQKMGKKRALESAITTLVHTTSVGGAGGHNYQVKDLKHTSNALVILKGTDFHDPEHYNLLAKHQAHIVYRERDANLHPSEMPDDVANYDKRSVVTVSGNSPSGFVDSIHAYISQIPELDEYDLFNTLKLLEDSGFEVDEYKTELMKTIKEEKL